MASVKNCNLPDELCYTGENTVWGRKEADGSGTIGMTAYACAPAGEVVAFPVGPDGAHQLDNRTDAPIRFLAVVAVGWIGVRVTLLWSQTGSLPQAIRQLVPLASLASPGAVAAPVQARPDLAFRADRAAPVVPPPAPAAAARSGRCPSRRVA